MQKMMISVTLIATLVATHSLGAERINIVTTTADLASIAQYIAGNLAKVTSLCPGNQDPHYLQVRPSLMMAARDADLWIRVGMELEIGWEGPVLDGCRNPRIRPGLPGHLDASMEVLKLEVPAQRVTREFGDVHPQGNPHYWLDPYNGRIVARTIAQRLSSLFPAYQEEFYANLEGFCRELDRRMFGDELVGQFDPNELWRRQIDGTLDSFLAEQGKAELLGRWLGTMRPFRGQKIVTYHRSWVYLANRFGLQVVAELEPKPGIPPSPRHLEQVAELIKQQGVRLVLQEPFYSTKAGKWICDRTGAKLLVVANSVGGQGQAKDYLSLIDLIVRQICDSLGSDRHG
ncbi:MAG: metal ABC transporter substrate-binding protein [Sedimentisphaerales bacterium]|nr:metal ABC transporter substrate-binding protein [Sedimentisphaerales bacterium]